MAGLNWIDFIIVLLLAAAVYGGLRVGFLILLLVCGGFFGGLFVGGWLFPHLLPIHDKTLLTLINGNLVLIFAVFVALRGFDVGARFHGSLGKGRARYLESVAGITLSVGSALIAIWLLAAMIGRLPFAGLSNSANDALIVQALDSHLPPVPAVFATFDRLIDPNSPPRVFVKNLPDSSQGAVLSSSASVAVKQAGASVVRITSFGCGSIVTGSGFTVGPGLIATDAHVIAGVRRPIIKAGSQSYAGVPVLFNPNLDFAVLRVSGLSTPPLKIATSSVSPGNTVSALGYPKGNYALTTGIIRNSLHVFGPNIFGVGTIGRDIYEIQIGIDQGSSGGPVILPDGQVAGIIFAKSDLVDTYGYAVAAPSLISEIHQAEKSYRRVGTGVCFGG